MIPKAVEDAIHPLALAENRIEAKVDSQLFSGIRLNTEELDSVIEKT